MKTFQEYTNLFKTMNYKEFKDYCNKRVCDGQWTIEEAMNCIALINDVEANNVKLLGLIPLKYKSMKLKEQRWEEIKKGELL